MSSRFGWLAALALGCSSGGASSEPCGGTGSSVAACFPGVEATGTVAGAPADFDGATAEICRAGACNEALMRLRLDGSGADCDAPLDCSAIQEGDAVRVKMSISLDLSEAKDGETYVFRITAESGAALVNFEGPVTFVRASRPCDEPCANATVDI